MEAVAAGRVDAYGGTSLTVQDLLDKAQNDAIERATPFTNPIIDGSKTRGYGAFAFQKAHPELRNAFNDVLSRFIGTEAHKEMVRPYGFTDAEQPGDKTAEQLCQANG